MFLFGWGHARDDSIDRSNTKLEKIVKSVAIDCTNKCNIIRAPIVQAAESLKENQMKIAVLY